MPDDLRQRVAELHDRFTHVPTDRPAIMGDMLRLAGSAAADAPIAAALDKERLA